MNEREALQRLIYTFETTDLGDNLAITTRDSYALADAVLGWMDAQGYRKAPEPEWEYAHSANGYWNDDETEFTAEEYGDVNDEPEFAIARRVKAGPWLPVEEKNP